MRHIAILLTLLFSLITHGAFKGVPFIPELDNRLDSIESLSDIDGIELPSAEIIVGDSNGNGNAIAMSGDTTISNAGAVTIAAGAVTEAKVFAQTADGLHLKRVARATLDCGASSCVAGDVALGVSLPAKSLVTQVYMQTVTQFVDGGAGTVALKCEDAANLFAAADITGIAVDATTSGIPIGTAGTMVSAIAATCVITATIAVAEQTAGVWNIFVEYVLHD